MKVSELLQLLPIIRMSGLVGLLSLYAFMTYMETTLCFTFTFNILVVAGLLLARKELLATFCP